MYETLIELVEQDGIRVVKVGNEVDIANAATLQHYLDDASCGVDRLIVSLEQCRYIDSTGLRPIMSLADRIGTGFFIVVPPGTQIRRIFDLTGLHLHMTVCDTLDAALALASAKVTSL